MPNTSLAFQLKKLQAPQTQLLIHRKKKDSFLFDPKEASNFDRDDIYELGLSGLEELKRFNHNFSAFDNTLFDVTSKFFERSVESSEANEKLNDQIKTFLTLLSPYFLLKPAHKALEWLINRYHINRFNVDDIMFLIFPYHETVLFSRMLQLIRIEKDTGKWHWLYNVKKRGVPLSKTALLNRASKDMGFLKFVCDMPAQAIKIHGSRASSLGTLFAFYCTTVIGGLQHADPINELHITHILPSVLAALSSSLLDYTASGFMIIARLATKTCLSPKVLSVFFNKISKVEHAKLRSETTLVFVLLCQNNEGKCEFPEKAAARIAEAPWFISSLATLNKSGIVLRPFLCLLLTTCLKRIQDGDEMFKSFVQKMLTEVNYKSDTAEQIFKILLEQFNGESSEETIKWFSEVIKGLEHSFPQVFDSVISAALSDEQSKAGVAVKIILGVNTSRNDLFLKLVHPNEDVRVQAIKHIGKHFEPDQVAWLSQTLLDRLKDDSPKVVRQFLRLPSGIISSLPKDTMVNNLLVVIARFSSTDEPIVMQAITILINHTSKEQEVVVLIAILPFIIPALYKSDIIENAPTDRLELLSVLKSNATRETNADVVLRESIASSGVLPPVDVVISTLMETKPLKDHSAFWFSSALLIGSKIIDHPSQENAELVMKFLTEFLHFPQLETIGSIEEIDENSMLFQSCFQSSIEGKLPIQGALYCLSNLSECISQHSFTRKPWLDPKNKSNAFTLSVYKVLLEGCNSNVKAVRVAFSQAQTSFFKKHFPDTEYQMLFLLNASMLDTNIGSKSLNLVIKMLNDDSKLISAILKEHSLVVPSLLILLGSSEETIRSKTLKILAIITDSFSAGFYRPLVEELVNHSTEILLDHEQIQIFAYIQLSPNKEIKNLSKETLAISVENVLHHLISILTNSVYPMYVKAELLRILEFVCSKEIFLQLFPVAIQLLGTSEELDEEESYVVRAIFKRLDHSVSVALKDEKFWNSLRIALADSKSTILSPEHEKGICPAAFILNQISKELFDELDESLQEKLISLILEKATDVENVQVINTAALFFKRISLDSKILLSIFTAMLNIFVPYSPNSLRARSRNSTSCLPSLETLETIEWKRGVCLLEFVQNKKKLSNINFLLPIFFSLLKKCLQFEQQAPVEYVKQLLLSSILHACKKLSTGESLSVPLENLQVDVVVECVRASHNPQTHHHALLALSYIAHLIPDQVLHNMMAIFTFIGSSVVRQDDAYSFQLISKIIETIIPILVKSQKGAPLGDAVTAVLRVFVATILDLPEHRRIGLFKKLLVTLDDGGFLWIFLCLAFEKHVLTFVSSENEEKSSEMGSMPRVLHYALQLCAEFPPPVILNTSLKLLQYISELPHDKEMYLQNKPKYKTSMIIFSIDENTGKNFRHYKYTLLTFLSTLMSSTRFVQQVSELSDEETFALKHLFGSIVEQCLVYIKSVSVQIELSAQLPTAKYWKVVLNQCYDILDKANALLPTEIFIEVVGQLLRNPLEAVRRKAMELLGWKLQQPTPLLVSQLRELLDPLISVLDSLHSHTLTNSESTDSHITQQAALFALKLMTRHLSSSYIEDFLKVLAKVTDILAFDSKLSGPVFGSLVLFLGELVSMLKVHSLRFLPKFMPPLMSAIHNLNYNSGDILPLSIVTAVQKIVEVVPQFLSPYLGQLLYEVCVLTAKHDTDVTDQQQKSLPLKLKSIKQKISSEVAVRVLVPAVSSAHSNLLKDGHYQAIGPLMTTLSDSFTSASDLSSETVKLFLSALEFRTIQPEPSLAESESVENPVIVAFTKLILKLSESSFRPLYQRIFDWATRKKASRERIITFYRLSYHLSNSLKSLFPLFLGIFIENAAEVLKKNNPAKQSENWFTGNYSTDKSILVVENIMKTFLTTFTHDSQKCLTKDYFNLIMEPLVDQLENRSGGNEISDERCKNIVIPCLVSMATSTGDDSLWKRLNHQILLKTKHSSPEVRMLGLKTTCSLAAKLGEDFMPLLPETVPFLAELLEDDVEEVEYECQKVVNEMEEILGESIKKYF